MHSGINIWALLIQVRMVWSLAWLVLEEAHGRPPLLYTQKVKCVSKNTENLDLGHWTKLIEESIRLYRRAPQTARCIWLLTYQPHQGQGTMRHSRHEPCWRGPILFRSIFELLHLFLYPSISYSLHSFFVTSLFSAFPIRFRLSLFITFYLLIKHQ